MIKVLFDHQIFSQQVYGGISRYFANIIENIDNTEEVEPITGILYSKNYYLKKNHFTVKEFLYKHLVKKKKSTYEKNTSYSKFLLKRNNFDVFHPTYFDPYFIPYLKKPFVITIHDMIYEVFPHFFPEDDPIAAQKKLVAERADKIIAISETTKKDIIKYLNIHEDKITVIPHGIDTDIPKYEFIEHLPKRYLLFVGSRGGYKNFNFLAEAFKKISQTDKTLNLVLAGGGTLTQEENEFLTSNKIIDKTFHLSATDNQLNTLYKNAICFVFPSLYEGFGIPILEAFKNDCPVLLSNCSCFPEIAGDAALYFAPESMSSLIDKIRLMMEDKMLRSKLINDGKLKLESYTLEKCLTATISVYQELTNQSLKV